MMKNIKTIGITALAILALNTACAQQWQFGILGGYGVGLGATAAPTLKVSNDPNTSKLSQEFTSVKTEFGRGINMQLNAAYMFNENVGLDLGFSYLMGSEFSLSAENSEEKQESILKLNMYRVLPSLVLATSLNDVQLYMKFGFNIGTGNIENTQKYTTTQSADDELQINLFSGGYSLGTQAALGMDFPISDNIKFTGEIYCVSANYAPTYREITRLDIGGVNDLPNQNYSHIHRYFEDEYTVDNNNDKTIPSIRLKNYFTVGNIGLQIGLKFVLD